MKIEFVPQNGDLLVVNAARASFDKESYELSLSDEKLIHFLAKHKHLLPFRHPQLTLRLSAPLPVIRQLDKHQVGFSTSEVSRRYVTGDPEYYHPESFRVRPENIKQGSQEPENEPVWWDQDNRGIYDDALDQANWAYQKLLENGVAPEQARFVLPQAMYTTQIKTGSLLGWHHLVRERTAQDAQKETRDMAIIIEEYLIDMFPVSWAALNNYL